LALFQKLNLTEDEILKYHIGGKVGMEMLKELKDKRSLSIAYTPGVATACLKIKDAADALYRYTAKGNLVAVVTDGTAVLGLGDIGARASIPVMEGKAVLFKAFAGIDAWPVPLENCRKGINKGPTDVERFVDHTASLACMYGGINLEDVAAPECFVAEELLQARVDCPVFHDDQWGTAIITLAALKNYCLLTGKDMDGLRVVISGAGAAGIRIAETIKSEGVKKLVILDSKGIIHSSRSDLNPYKRKFAIDAAQKSLTDVMTGADVFIGVSRPNLLTQEMICSMGEYPAIFAMANPEPEIKPEDVESSMKDRPYIMATGRSDYPNQINNVLGFPYIFRGALDVRARRISMSMKRAAAEALANVAQLEAPEYLKGAYPGDMLRFGPEYIIPKPFDKRLLVEVSYAVANAAVEEGVASIKDITNYRYYLEALANMSKEDCSIPFIIDKFCQFSDNHTICTGKDMKGEKRGPFLCGPHVMDIYRHDKSLLGKEVTISVKKGKITDILPFSNRIGNRP